MIFAIAIPQFFGFERSSEGTTTTTLTKDGRILQLDGWMAGLVQLYQLSGNRCVCVWRTRWWNDTVGVWVGAWLFIFFLPNLLLFSLQLFVCYSLPPAKNAFFPAQPTDHDTTTHQTTTSRYSMEAQDERPQGIGCVFRYLTHHHHHPVVPHSYRDLIPQKAVS